MDTNISYSTHNHRKNTRRKPKNNNNPNNTNMLKSKNFQFFKINLFQIVLILIYSNLPFTKPDSSNLLDTRDETMALNWQTYASNNQKGWLETSSPYTDYRSLMICQINAQNQDNWVRSNFIKIDDDLDTKLVYIEISFSVRTCEDVSNVKSCREAFTLAVLESDFSGVNVTRGHLSKFRHVETLAAQERFSKDGGSDSENSSSGTSITTKTVTVDLTNNKKGFYLALQDTGACLSIQYIRVYYKFCPQKTINFVNYPATMAGNQIELAKGTCVENSSIQKGRTRHPFQYCDTKGNWMKLEDQPCHCNQGFEGSISMGQNTNIYKCVPCTQNFYKSNPGPETCNRCPLNSSTKSNIQQSVCSCNEKFYRAATDTLDSKCTKPPGPVDHLKGDVEGTSVNITWSAPADNGGRDYSDIKYQVECAMKPTSTNSARTTARSRLRIISDCSVLGQNYIKNRVLRVTNLRPQTVYRFKIYSFNSVSEKAKSNNVLPNFTVIDIQTETISVTETTPTTPRIDRVPDYSNDGTSSNNDQSSSSFINKFTDNSNGTNIGFGGLIENYFIFIIPTSRKNFF